jgi:hypothetical protein
MLNNLIELEIESGSLERTRVTIKHLKAQTTYITKLMEGTSKSIEAISIPDNPLQDRYNLETARLILNSGSSKIKNSMNICDMQIAQAKMDLHECITPGNQHQEQQLAKELDQERGNFKGRLDLLAGQHDKLQANLDLKHSHTPVESIKFYKETLNTLRSAQPQQAQHLEQEAEHGAQIR